MNIRHIYHIYLHHDSHFCYWICNFVQKSSFLYFSAKKQLSGVTMKFWIRNSLNKLNLVTHQDFYYELWSNGKYKSRPNRTFYSVEDINKCRERVTVLSSDKVDFVFPKAHPTEVARAPLIEFQKLVLNKVFYRLKLFRKIKFYTWMTISGRNSVKKGQKMMKKATNLVYNAFFKKKICLG